MLLISAMSWHTDVSVLWRARLDELYTGAEGDQIAYLYSPSFAQILEPFRSVPVETFVLLLRLTALASLAYLARWLTLPLLLTLPVLGELLVGNIHLQLALAVALTFRYPAAWAVPLLTKPSLGIGLVWYAVRREWRQLGIALAVTAGFVAVSFVIAPTLWFDWIVTMANSSGPLDPELARQAIGIPLFARLLIAGVLVAWGARGNRRWTLVVGTCIALPTLWIVGLSMLVGLARFGPTRRATDRSRQANGGDDRIRTGE